MDVEFTSTARGHTAKCIALFKASFGASEGVEEGDRIAALAGALMRDTAKEDLRIYAAWDADQPIGCIIFTRLKFADDPRQVFLLSPVAVSPHHQGTGVGQQLLTFGLDQLRAAGADIAVTYGNPDYYRRVGFAPVTVEHVPPPLPLTLPHGWLAQSLTGEALSPLPGPSRCAAALDDPAYW